MKLSTNRILTTHVGSLPRSARVVEQLRLREDDKPYDKKRFETTIAEAVDEIVAWQAEAGVDVVSDGEMSKIAYGTYVKERLSGFSGEGGRPVMLDMQPYPDLIWKMSVVTGAHYNKREACTGPISMKSTEDCRRDIAHMKHAVANNKVVEGFLTAASPGVVTVFAPNRYYKTYEEYVFAAAEAMREEYELIVKSGLVLQLDCPDLAMGYHSTFQGMSKSAFIRQAAIQVEAMNHALRNIPAEKVRMHVCWGNYEGPHDLDLPVESIMHLIIKAKPSAVLFEAANPRHEHEWVVWRDTKLPDNKILVPGVISSTINYIEHPELVAQRIERYAEMFGRERVMAGTDCGFGTSAGWGKVDPAIVKRKLQSLAEGAAIASKRLWAKSAKRAARG